MVILCTIDLETREVSLPAGQVIASYDHNVDVIRFQAEAIPGFSLNTSSIRIAAQGPNKARHDYAVDPATVSIEEETGYITFDWPIPAGVTEMPLDVFKYGDKGNLIFAVCAEIISGSTLSKAWHSDDGIITVVAHLEPESGGGEDPSEEATNAQKIAQLQTDVAVINTQVGALGNGSPTPAKTVAEMTEHDKVYLYTGSESGYTAGNWYYYNGSAWTSGGTYGGAVTDTTLSISGAAADAKAVGDALAEKADADDLTAVQAALAGKADTDEIGDLSQLTTTAKDNLVAAINEANGAITGLNGRLDRVTESTDSVYNVVTIDVDNSGHDYITPFSGNASDTIKITNNGTAATSVYTCTKTGTNVETISTGIPSGKTITYILTHECEYIKLWSSAKFNITFDNTSTVIGELVDASLSESGKAADAKTVGNKLNFLAEQSDTVLSLKLDSQKEATFDIKPNRILFKKIHIEKPVVINSITVHSTNHVAGQRFNIAIYNANFTELTTMSGKNRGGATLRYFVETGERGFLGNDTECTIPKVVLCGDYLIAFKTTAQLTSTVRAIIEDSYCTDSYYSEYPSRITSGLSENAFAVDVDLNYKQEPIEISRQVSVVNIDSIHVCGIDSSRNLYGYNNVTKKIVTSNDNGVTWIDMCDYTYTPLQIVVDKTNGIAFYSSGSRIFKLTGLGEDAIAEEITPTNKRHSFAMTLCESLCIANGYLWYGEYSTATGAADGSYSAEASNQLNYPYLLRYNIQAGVWHRSAQFSARHVHTVVPDTNCIYVIVGDYNIGQDVGIHRLMFSDIVDDADLQDGIIRYTSFTTQSFVGRMTISGQNWYNVNALIRNVNGIKCLVGGSDRPLASCVITKLDDEVAGEAVSFPQCFSYEEPPADETSWNSFFDDRGNLWVTTRETATSKLMVMTPPYNKVYLIYDFGELLPYVGGYYSSANNVLWVGNKKINLPYIGTANSVTAKSELNFLTESFEKYVTENYGNTSVLPNGYINCGIEDTSNSSAHAGIITTDYFDATNYKSVFASFYITGRSEITGTVRVHLDAVDESGTKVKETFLAIAESDVENKVICNLDISSLSGNIKIRAYLNIPANNPNARFSGVIEDLKALSVLNQF